MFRIDLWFDPISHDRNGKGWWAEVFLHDAKPKHEPFVGRTAREARQEAEQWIAEQNNGSEDEGKISISDPCSTVRQ